MRKKPTVITIVALALIAIGIFGLLLWQNLQKPDTKQEALQQARTFECRGVSSSVMTPAVHTATGAEYTFGSTCMPEGWQAKPRGQ